MLGPVLTVLPLVIFYILVSVFSDGAESSARGKVVVVSIVVTVLLRVVSGMIPTLPGLLLACLVAAVVSLVGLMFWIKVTKLQALKITGSYIGCIVGLSLVLVLIFHPSAA